MLHSKSYSNTVTNSGDLGVGSLLFLLYSLLVKTKVAKDFLCEDSETIF